MLTETQVKELLEIFDNFKREANIARDKSHKNRQYHNERFFDGKSTAFSQALVNVLWMLEDNRTEK